jgi:beta-phosphoglucomutase
MIIKALIFDFDGVILDTGKYHFQSWEILLQKIGLSIEPADDLFLKGAGRMDSLEYLLRKGQLQLPNYQKRVLTDEKNRIFLNLISHLTKEDLLPGVNELIEQARSLDFQLAVGSGSKNARRILEDLGIASLFDVIQDANDVAFPKPHPEIYQLVCSKLKLHPAETLVIEDSSKGVASAIATGCYILGLGDPEYLEGANLIAPDLSNIKLDDLLQNVSRDLIA